MLLSVPRAHLGNQTTFTHYVSFGSSWLWDIFQTHLVFDDSFEKYCCCSVAKSCLTLCNPMNRSTPSLPALHCLLSLLKFISTESVKTSNHLILCHSLLLLPSIFPSIRVFSNESSLWVLCLLNKSNREKTNIVLYHFYVESTQMNEYNKTETNSLM